MAEKKKEPIYTLNIFHTYNERLKDNTLVLLIQTVRIFVNFKYEILLEDKITDHSININIIGLHVPEILIPQTGPAQGYRHYSDLKGEYVITVTKQDKTSNEFVVNINQDSIEIKKQPKKPFILISNQTVNLLL